MSLFKKKTLGQKITSRIESVFFELTSEIEHKFSPLEIVQILNEVRRKLDENLCNKKSETLSKITECQQTANDIQNAIDYLN